MEHPLPHQRMEIGRSVYNGSDPEKFRLWLYAPAYAGRKRGHPGDQTDGGCLSGSGLQLFRHGSRLFARQERNGAEGVLTSRYPRDRYILTDKLTANYFKTEADIRPLFESQLAACGADYFDFYLMHAQGTTNYPHFKACRAYETAFALKAEGKVRHVGISFHDRAEVLEQILTEYPDIEVVQIQFNYVDYDDPAVQSWKCYEVCRKFNKPVLVMEPVKGGNLVNLPEEAKAVLEDLHGGSPASYAIRFAAGFPGMMIVLSSMSNLQQMEDNLAFMRDFKPLNETELAAVKKVQEIFRSKQLIPCTSCQYCTDGCPKHISIPDLFATMNTKQLYHDWNADYYYNVVHTAPGRRASDCLKCGKCEKACPSICPSGSCWRTWPGNLNGHSEFDRRLPAEIRREAPAAYPGQKFCGGKGH